jgi:precorrin-3B synthase
VRNIMVSPLTGVAGGRADLRPVAADLDQLIRARPALAGLPGRFQFVLDDGRGDLVDQSTDLGLVVLDGTRCQLRVGDDWGPVVPLANAATACVGLTEEFLRVRGDGPDAPWHLRELPQPLVGPAAPDARLPPPAGPLPHGPLAGADHVAVPGGVLEPRALTELVTRWPELVVTPWHGVAVPVPVPVPVPGPVQVPIQGPVR